MHLFDAEDTSDTQRRFWTVLGSVSGVTYLIAAAGLGGIHQSKRFREWLADKLSRRTPPLGYGDSVASRPDGSSSTSGGGLLPRPFRRKTKPSEDKEKGG